MLMSTVYIVSSGGHWRQKWKK